jgi:hypothetical protein
MRIRRSVAVLVAAAATALALAAPAAAAPAPTAVTAVTGPATFAPAACDPARRPDVGFGANELCYGRYTYGGSWVDVWWGFTYNAANNHLRAIGQMIGNFSSIRTRADALNLGDRNGVLVSTPGVAMGTLNLQTDPAVSCHKPNGVYVSALHFSIRWPNNALTSGGNTGQQTRDASIICS